MQKVLEDLPWLGAGRCCQNVSRCGVWELWPEMNWRRWWDGRPRRRERCRDEMRHRQELRMKQRQCENERGGAELRGDGEHCGPAVLRAEQGSGFYE